MKKHNHILPGCIVSAIFLSLILLIPQQVSADTVFNDIEGHWAKTYITRAVNQGFIKGYPDGSFKPDRQVTRAEFVSMVNRALGNTGTSKIYFSDVRNTDWYYSDVSKAVCAAFVTGFNDNTFKPNQSITRQEAAVIISNFIPTYGQSARLQSFSDYGKISSWASTALSKVCGKGYLSGYTDGKIHPLDALTRAQAAKIIGDIVVNETIVTADPVVKKDGTRLLGKIYTNDLTIHKDLDDDSVTIENCVVLGTLKVQGGGTDTVTVYNSRIANASVDRSNSAVRLLAKGETTIENIEGKKEFILQTSGLAGGNFGTGFKRVSIDGSSNATLIGTFPYVSIDGSYVDMTLESGTINDLNVSASGKKSDITVESGATVKNTSVYAESYFHGSGTISNMQVYAKNITYETKPKSWSINSGGETPEKTDPGLVVTFSPNKGATNVYCDTKITVTFSLAMAEYDGSSISSDDIEDIITLRKGSLTGSSVPFSATINSAKKIITVTPDSILSNDTKYYIIVEEDTMRDANGNYNDEVTSYFTTGDETQSLTVKYSPANGATNVPVDTRSFTITFSDSVIKYNGSEISSSTDKYLKNSVVIFRKNGKDISTDDYTVSINNARKVITVTSKSNLSLNTKYYVGIAASTLKREDGTAIAASGATWTTAGAPSLSSAETTSFEYAIDIKVTPNVNGTIYAVALSPGASAPNADAIKAGKDGSGNAAEAAVSSSASASGAKTLKLSGLSTDTQYKIYAVLYDGNGNASAVVSKDAKTSPLLLGSLEVIPAGGTSNIITDFSPNKMNYPGLVVPNGTASVDVTALASAAAFIGTLSINGDSDSIPVNVPIIDGEAVIEIILQETGKTAVKYTVTIREAGSSELDSMTINETSYTPGTVYTLPSYNATSVELNIIPADPNAKVYIDGILITNGADFTLTIGDSSDPKTFTIRSYDGSSVRSYTILFERPAAPPESSEP